MQHTREGGRAPSICQRTLDGPTRMYTGSLQAMASYQGAEVEWPGKPCRQLARPRRRAADADLSEPTCVKAIVALAGCLVHCKVGMRRGCRRNRNQRSVACVPGCTGQAIFHWTCAAAQWSPVRPCRLKQIDGMLAEPICEPRIDDVAPSVWKSQDSRFPRFHDIAAMWLM